jgi:type I site-specific restriction endonuclease
MNSIPPRSWNAERVLFIVDRIELAKQTLEEFAIFLPEYCSAAQKSLKWEAGECMVGWELSGRVPSIT